MMQTNSSGDNECRNDLEQEIASWVRLGYKRDQLIILPDGTVIPDTDKHQTVAIFDALA